MGGVRQPTPDEDREERPLAEVAIRAGRTFFAHVGDTGGARRTRLRGIEKARKRTLITAAARNLGLLMRKLFDVGKPRALQGLLASLINQLAAALKAILSLIQLVAARRSTGC